MDEFTQGYAQPTTVSDQTQSPVPEPVIQPVQMNAQPIEQPLPIAPQPIPPMPEPIIQTPSYTTPIVQAPVNDQPMTPVQVPPPTFMTPEPQPVIAPPVAQQSAPTPYAPTDASVPNPLTQPVPNAPIPTVPTEAPLSENSTEAQEAAKPPAQTFAIDKNSFVGMLDLDPQAAQIEQMAAQSPNPAAVLTQAESQADKDFALQLRTMGIPEDAILEALKAKQQERPELAPSTQLVSEPQQ